MDDDFDKSVVTFHFNVMTYLGSWVIDTDSRVKRWFYRLYGTAVTAWVLFMVFMGVLDFIDVYNQMGKVIYNVCLNLLIFGTWAKTMQIVYRAKTINNLRRSLHRSIRTCKDEREVQLYNDSLRDIKFIIKLFYFFLLLLYPIWMTLSLFSSKLGDRAFPLPAKWPFPMDINDFQSFILTWLYHGIFSLFYLQQALSMDVSMFGLLVEICREFKFLLKQIEEFGDFCNNPYKDYGAQTEKNGKLKEINIFLQKAKAKKLLREIVLKQTELFRCIQEFENSYKLSMFIQIFAGGVLQTVNGIQAMIVSFQFDIKMSYQIGYVFVIMSDVLYLCWITDKISTKSFEAGTALYSTPWYKMDVDIQKDISFVILRSQRFPRITSGGVLELNLRTFMLFMKNIYSWLALFRQVAFK